MVQKSNMRGDITSYLWLMDAWQDALYLVCHSVAIHEGEEATKEVHQQEQQQQHVKGRDDCNGVATNTMPSPWDDAFDLLCRAMVTDEELEEKLTWDRLVAESRSAIMDDDDDDDILYKSVDSPQ